MRHSHFLPVRRTGAFTLVELLVVIGIIALLISILLPSLSKARIMANRTACASNMRQLTMALQMYMSDYEGGQPMWGMRRDDKVYKDFFFPVALSPYLMNTSVAKAAPNTNSASMVNGGLGVLLQQVIDGSVQKTALFCPTDAWVYTGVTPNTFNSFAEAFSVNFTSYGTVQAGWDGRWESGSTPGTTIGGPGPLGTHNPYDPPHKNRNDEKMPKALSKRKYGTQAVGVFAHRGAIVQPDGATASSYTGVNASVEEYGSARKRMPNYRIAAVGGDSHDDKLPFAFLDGHVEIISYQEFRDPDRYGPFSNTPLWLYQ